MFLHKTSRTGDKLIALEKRIIELQERIADREQSINEKREDLGKVIGEVALKETTENLENMKSAKKALEKMHEVLNESRAMLQAAETERLRLLDEMAAASVREAPAKLEEFAKSYNLLLDEAIGVLEAIEILHKKAKQTQDNFYSLSNERSNALSKLGKIEPLNLSEGLGRLSNVGSPYASAFIVADSLEGFFRGLIQYRASLKSYEQFKISNPTFDEDMKRIEAESEESKLRDQYRPFSTDQDFVNVHTIGR